MLWRRSQARQKFDLILEEPSSATVARRLQRFFGYLQSDRPVPAFRVLLERAEQPIERWDSHDPNAPVDRRHTAYFVFHRELAAAPRLLDLDVMADDGRIAHRRLRREPPDDRTDKPLVFVLHIPKTAGTSLRLALELQPAIRLLRLYPDRAFLPISRCETLTPEAFDDLDVVLGHFHHGLHRFARRPHRYVSVLRHPADLVKSHYLFNKYVLRAERYRDATSIGDILAAPDAGIDNLMTRYIAGKATPGPVDAEDLARACAHIEREFAYVGTVEDMETTLRVLGDYLAAPLGRQRVNATPSFAEADAITREGLMREHGRVFAHDMRLYERARTVFAAGIRT